MEICLYLKLKEEKLPLYYPASRGFFYYIFTEIYYNIYKTAMLGRKSRTETRQTKEITI